MKNLNITIPDELAGWVDSEASLDRRSRSNFIAVALEEYRARRQPRVLLTPGKHTVDGKPVDIPPDGDRPQVWYPLAAGRHEVDGHVMFVHAHPGTYPVPPIVPSAAEEASA